MKRKIKFLTAMLLSAVTVCAVGSFAGCKQVTYTGEYHYNVWGTDYGIKVNVQVQTDKDGDRIRKVTVAESDYVAVSTPMNAWTQENVDAWNNGLQTLLNAYRGQYVGEILAQTVAVKETGEPIAKVGEGFIGYDNELIMTGATVGSGRLLLAVQNALTEVQGYQVVEGEYHYNSWGTEYGIKAKVVVKDGVVQGVAKIPSDYVDVSSPMNAWTQNDVNQWNNGLYDLTTQYRGKSVSYLLEQTVAVKESGEPVAKIGEGFIAYDNNLIMTGATIGSGRLLLAVQNALGKL